MATSSIDAALRAALRHTQGSRTPPRLRAALDHAVLGGGRRVRPRLALGVAQACGNDAPDAAVGVAVAIEMLHCASLVHDDLPCFDDADMRRGRPSVHAAHGEQLAVLAGDGLIITAFEALAESCHDRPDLLAPLVRVVADGVGSKRGIVAGQAWECEAAVDLRSYHRQKTGALFDAAVAGGAIAGGGDPEAWSELSRILGEAYQLADDIHDRTGDASRMGKPVGQDAAHGRPNAADALGLSRAAARLARLLAELPEAVPECPGRAKLQAAIRELSAELSDAFVGEVTQPSVDPGFSTRETLRLQA